MSKSNNSITNYFKRTEVVDNVEKSDKMSSESSSTDDNEPLHVKHVRLNEFGNSTSLPITSTRNSTTNSLTQQNLPFHCH